MAPPPTPKLSFNRELPGVYGEFGSGSQLQALYVQSTIQPTGLDMISLISDIPGSERWAVRDLFQRDVDNQRVQNTLLPYLQNEEKIKFFNPLTLTILPMDLGGESVLSDVSEVREYETEEDGHKWNCIERKNFFRILFDEQRYAKLEWNDERSRLVAIDGQHRLSALKRIHRDEMNPQGRELFMKWRIPVVVVLFKPVKETRRPSKILNVVRNIFIDINTHAQKVNRAREILLSDDSINAVCTQELIQCAHSNDLAKEKDRPQISSRIPLLFYDWRGEERDGKRVPAPAAAKTVEEIHDWFEHYILGDDFTEEQKIAFGIVPPSPLKEVFVKKQLSYETSGKIRELFQDKLLPALSHFLENFAPYKDYIHGLREIEAQFTKDSGDLGRFAFDQLRFGSNRGMPEIQDSVEKVRRKIEEAVEKLKKEHFHRLLREDYGMRGIVYALGALRKKLNTPSWDVYSEWFTSTLNQIHGDKWLSLEDKKVGGKHLRNVIHDHNDTVVNYRLEHAGNALGTYVMLLVSDYGRPHVEKLAGKDNKWRGVKDDEWDTLREECLDTLSSTIKYQLKKKIRAELREDPKFANGGRPLTEAVNQEAEKEAKKQIENLDQRITKQLKTLGQGADKESAKD